MSETGVRPLIHKAAAEGVKLWVEEGQLHFKSEKGKLTDLLRVELKSRKGELIGELSPPIFRKRTSQPAIVKCQADRIGFWKYCENNIALRHGTHCVFTIRGAIEIELIERAFKRVISRHDLLRARVRMADDGVPSLQLNEHPTIPFSVADLSAEAATSSPEEIAAAVERAVYAPFEDGQIYRAQVIKVSDSEHVVAVVIHHFVMDAFSVVVLARDLVGGLQEDRLRDVERPLQYADYLLGMSEWLLGPGLAYRLGLWKEKMREAQGVRFPLTDEGPPGGFGKLGTLKIHIGKELRTRLADAISLIGVPLSTAILAVNFAALASMFQRKDFFATVLYLGRDDPALLDMVGSTIGSVPVRATLEAHMSFADLLLHVQEAFAFAVAYRVPWGILSPVLKEIGAGSVAPFFNYRTSARAASTALQPSTHGSGLRIEPVTIKRPEHAVFEDWKSYELQAFDTGVELQLTLRYMPSVYQTTSFEAFADTFLRFLEALANDPRCRPWSLEAAESR